MHRHVDPQGAPLAGMKRPPAQPAALSRPDKTGWDAVDVLIIYFLLLLVLPSNRTIEALGGAGSPAVLFALIFLPWWGWYHVQRTTRSPLSPAQPVRAAMFVLLGCVIASYAAGSLRVLTESETNALNLGLLRSAAFASVLVLANDGIPSRERLVQFLRWCCLLGGLYAGLGILQFFSGQSFVANLSIPGLSISDFGALQERGGFSRPSSTARNPLEYAYVLSMLFPVAICLALHDRERNSFLRWFPVAAIAVAAMLSVSRSAIVGIVVAILVLFPFWSSIVRRRAGIAAVALLAAVWALVPGMVGTLMGLFGGEDPSLKSRTESYDIVWTFWQMDPVFGRGLGTFLPEYRILDNQYLVSLMDIGTLGLAAFVAVPVTAFLVALAGRRRHTDPLFVHLGPGLAASVAAGTSLTGFFDALSFPQAAGSLFLVAGLCGAYWRLKDHAQEPGMRGDSRQADTGWVVLRRWPAALAVLVLMVPVIVNAGQSKGVYWTRENVVFLPPPGASAGNPLRSDSQDIVQFASVIQRRAIDKSGEPPLETNGASLYATGIRQGYSVYLPNAGTQWQPSFDRAMISIEVVAEEPSTVSQVADELARRIALVATQEQDALGVIRTAHISTGLSPSVANVSYHATRPAAATAALAVLSLGLSAGAISIVDKLLLRNARNGRSGTPRRSRALRR